MKKYYKKILGLMILGVVLAGFSGCGANIPKCDDESVQEVLSSILVEQGIVRNGKDLSYSNFMTEKTDKESKTIYCKANVEDKSIKTSAWMTYSARYTDNKDMVYVEISDIQ